MPFRPKHYVRDCTCIDLDALRASGVTTLLIDVDNTVSPHHSTVVLPEMVAWIASLEARGFKVRLVSNNWSGTIHDRAAALGAAVTGKACKPLPFGFLSAARELGVRPGECAVIGDQIFTDILGGNLVGATTVLVQPLTEVDLPHTRVLRRLERFIMSGRKPKG